jgi:hypothetical protein
MESRLIPVVLQRMERMRLLVFLLFPVIPLNGYAVSKDAIKSCERITIERNDRRDGKILSEKKRACRQRPEYEICVYEGLKQYRDGGALIPVPHLEALEENCSEQAKRK